MITTGNVKLKVVCAKCHSDDVYFRWHSGEEYEGRAVCTELHTFNAEQEHFLYQCRKCGFSWHTEVFNAAPNMEDLRVEGVVELDPSGTCVFEEEGYSGGGTWIWGDEDPDDEEEVPEAVFDEYEIDDAIDRAIDIAYPVFQLFGWEWGGTVPSRREMRRELESLVGNAKEFNMESESVKRTGCGRFWVTRESYKGLEEIYITLDLSTIYSKEEE